VSGRRSGPGHTSATGGFFDRFRTAIARLPNGLIRTGPPAPSEALAQAEASLGRPLPEAYASFLRSFDGADLFHENILVAGVGPGAPRQLVELPQTFPNELVFGEALSGELFALDERGRVLRRDVGADERALAGSSFERWLDATVAREQVLYGPDGEYLPDLTDPSGTELLPQVALRQAERALRADPGAADAEHARGSALLRLGRPETAVEAFRRAAELDVESPWPAFDLGRAALTVGQPEEALAAFRRAAELETGVGRARLLAWAARAAAAAHDGTAAATLREEAKRGDPELVDHLRRAARAAVEDEDPEATAEATALLEVIEPGAAGLGAIRRLPVLRSDGPPSRPERVLSEPASPSPPPARPPRPSREEPPRSGGSKRGRRR